MVDGGCGRKKSLAMEHGSWENSRDHFPGAGTTSERFGGIQISDKNNFRVRLSCRGCHGCLSACRKLRLQHYINAFINNLVEGKARVSLGISI